MSHSEFSEYSDTELVRMTFDNREVFAHIIHRYEAKLTRYIRRISNMSTEDIEDMLQNVFIKAYVNLQQFDTSLSFNSWIYRITHNEVIDTHRKYQRQFNYGASDIDDDIFERTSALDSLLKEIEVRDQQQDIVRVLQELDLKYREILILRFFEEKSYEEIGDILKKPTSTIGTLVRRAKVQFKHSYQQYYDIT